jgi:hypothetical protein
MSMTDKRENQVPTKNPMNSALTREKRERFNALSSRIGEAYANLPEDEGMAEIDAAVSDLRRR